MIIAVPKEIKDHEYRVALTPEAVSAVVADGHRVLVERGAGDRSGFPDEAYRKVGGQIVDARAALFDEAEMIVKVKEPLPSEFNLFQKGQTLVTFLHLSANRPLTELLLQRNITAIGYETIQNPDGSLPVLRPMSEIAGRMSTLMGAFYLQKVHGGSGVLLPGIPGVSPARIVILGGGTVGMNAARTAVGLGGRVTLFHRETDCLEDLNLLAASSNGKMETRFLDPELIERFVLDADLVIGAVLIPGAKAPRLVGRELVVRMRKGSVVVDVSIDQGGCFETSRATTHSDPVYDVEGIIHYCVSNMPGAYPRTATTALVNVTLPYLLKMAKNGVAAACHDEVALAKGLNTYNGKVCCAAVAEAHGFSHETF